MKEINGIKMYKLAELAEMMQIDERTVQRYLHGGKMKGQKIGKFWYVSENSLKDFLDGKY